MTGSATPGVARLREPLPNHAADQTRRVRSVLPQTPAPHVLAEPEWAGRLTDADLRGLTPLVWSNISPYGTFHLDMDTRLDLQLVAA